MRILVVHPGSDFSVADVHEGYVRALRDLGNQVAVYNSNDRLVYFANSTINGRGLNGEEIVQHAMQGLHGKLWEWMPELVVVISGFYVMPVTWQILAHRPEHRTAVIFTESPYEDDRQLHLVEEAEPDIVILNDPINIDRFRKAHNNVRYLPHCYDPNIHYPGGDRDLDFVFVGTGYDDRVRLFDAVDWTGIRPVFAGNWPHLEHTQLSPFLVSGPADCIENAEAAGYYRRAKVSANRYRREANLPALENGWAVGPREVELAACGTYFLRDQRGESDLLFPMLPTFEGPDDLGDHVRWALAHPAEREAAAAKARAAIKDRTFTNNARQLLALLEP